MPHTHVGENSMGEPPQSDPSTQAGEQYFVANPTVPDKRKRIHITARGRELDLETSLGVFSMNKLDLGTSVLLKQTPTPPEQGTFLDLGCGWGPIAITLGFESPQSTIWALDVNERAIQLTQENARRYHLTNIHAVTADQLPEDISFDLIWSNPPIRIGKNALHELLEQYLSRLSANGIAYLVVQKNLGSDSLITWINNTLSDLTASKYASSKGYRLILVQRKQ